jgi:transposase, IS30 family
MCYFQAASNNEASEIDGADHFTKRCDFETIASEDVEQVMNKLNQRPRKSLDFRTPHEVFFEEIHQDVA